jgi:hypothetical protein
MRDYGPNFPQSNPGEAALYLVREAAPVEAAPINLTIGRRPVGSLTGLTYMRFDLQPRLYDLHAYGVQSGTEQIITVAPGQTRFLQVEATPTGGVQFLEISWRDGRRMVSQAQRLPQMQDPPRD